MKIILKSLLFIVLALIVYGFYMKNQNEAGDKFIGFGVLILSFVLMPLFIYHRYKDKNLKDYSFKDMHKEED